MTKIEMPDDTERVADFADFQSAYLTVERGDSGEVFFVSWWYGDPKVIVKVFPGGSIEAVEDV